MTDLLADEGVRFGLWFQQWLLFGAYAYGLFSGWSAVAVCGVFLWCGCTAWLRSPSLFQQIEGHVMTYLLTVHIKQEEAA